MGLVSLIYFCTESQLFGKEVKTYNQTNKQTCVHFLSRHRDPIEVPSSRLKLFEQTDADGDGFVTKHEYGISNGIDDNATDVEDLFMTYDRDNDGKLSEQEFVDQSSPWDVINGKGCLFSNQFNWVWVN